MTINERSNASQAGTIANAGLFSRFFGGERKFKMEIKAEVGSQIK